MADLRYAEMLSLGYDSACASFSGAIKCLGRNDKGQLGNGTTTDSMSSAVVVQGLSQSITQLSSGDFHTCGLESGGGVKCWGSNSSGQLGDGSSTSRTAAVSVSQLTGATYIGAGGGTTCAVVALGAVKCWGSNSSGQLGLGPGPVSTVNRTRPEFVTGVTGATKVFTNYSGTSCALLGDGTIKCWGYNYNGQVGNGTINTTFPYAQFTPVTVTGISTAVDLYLGYGHACAVLADGTVKCWGSNSYGQLGNGTTTDSSTPVTVSGITDAAAIGHGDGNYSCAVMTFGPGGVGGNVKCWGTNAYGMVGNGGTNSTSSPNKNVYEIKNTPPPAPTVAAPTATTGPTASITFKGESGATFECSLDGESWATCTSSKSLTGLTDGWHSFSVRGKSSNGTGDASTVSWVADATPPAKPTVSSTAVGTTRQTGATVTWSAALEADETVTCSKDGGAFTACGASPVSLSGLADGDHSFAVKATDSFGNAVTSTASWKVNGAAAASVTGDTGDPTTTSGALTGASAIALGASNGCVLISPGGTVKCWGWFKSDISPSDKVMPPTEVSGVSGATAIAVGGTNGCALIPGGTVKCWGDNYYYQLGAGTSEAFSDSAVQIAGITDATGIAVGENYLCASLASRRVVCWGGSSSDNTRNATPVPVKYQPPNPTGPPVDWKVDAASIWAVPNFGMCILDGDGAPMCWGNTRDGLPSPITWVQASTGGPPALNTYSGAVQVTGFTDSDSNSGLCFRRASGSLECVRDSSRFAISGLSVVSDISAYAQSGAWHDSGCAVVTAGAVKCWGNNHYGKLGDGTTTDSPSPVMGLDVLDLQPVSVKDLGAAAVKVAVGPSTACAILVDTHVKCWGDGTGGQLGNGTKDSSLTPIEVGGGTTTNPPPAPVIAAPSATTATSTAVTFKGEKGATFECKTDGGSWSACTSPASLSSLSEGWHAFAVRATNSGGTGDASTVSWVSAASTKPDTPVLVGAPAGTVRTTSASVSFSSASTGVTYTCSVDGGSYAECTSPKALTGLSDGSHSLSVKASRSGLDSDASSASWTIDATAPDRPTLTPSVSGFAPSGGVLTGKIDGDSLSITVAAETGASLTCSYDGGSFSACSSPLSISGLATGATKTVSVKATDAVGNVSDAASLSVTRRVPVAKPTLSGAPSGTVATDSASVVFTSTTSGATFTCSVDGGSYSACSSPKSLSGLSDGSHSLSVKAAKDGGESDAASASWTVDTSAPAAPALSGVPGGPSKSKTASIAFSSESGATFTCSVDGASYSACRSPKGLSGLSDGAHSIAVRAVDLVGNMSDPATGAWTVDTVAPAKPVLSGAPSGFTSATSASISAWT
jgi:alpha-tubulin suppressor-like RCC1 family protein